MSVNELFMDRLIIGGSGHDSTGVISFLNDLWKFDGSNWVWVSGRDMAGEIGSYGTLGNAASSNIIGGRLYGISWADSYGDLWLFGGIGLDSAGSNGSLNDLWLYQP